MIPAFPSTALIPPLPMTRREARAAGLKTFTAALACRLCRSKQRTVHTGACCGCAEVEKRKLKALAEKVREKVLVSARAQVLRQLASEAREAAKAADKAARAQQRAAAKEQATKERKAAARAAARVARQTSAKEDHQAGQVLDSPPWEGIPSEADSAARWD